MTNIYHIHVLCHEQLAIDLVLNKNHVGYDLPSLLFKMLIGKYIITS